MQKAIQNFEQEEQFAFHPIDELQNEGINAADITKLKNAGLGTINSVLMRCRKEIAQIKGMSDAKIDKIIQASKKIEGTGFLSANSILQRRKVIKKVSTGSSKLDALLRGIESMSITQVFGQFWTGKTQMAHTLCVTCQLPRSQGGGEGKACYIDTQGTFRPEKIIKIAQRFQLSPDQVLDNIVSARAHTVDSLNALLIQAAAMMRQQPFALLVVDSIMAPFRVDYSGRGQLAERQQVLAKILNKLQKLSQQFNVVVFLTNQVMSDPGGGMTYAVDPKKPVGGNTLAHASATRLYLKKGKGDMRNCKVYDSPCVPESEESYQLSDGGIIDVTDV